MTRSLPTQPSDHQRELSDIRPKMAKVAAADVRNAEPDAWKTQIGQALQRAMTLAGWSLKEFAAAVDRDPRQCARWMDGSERPQFDVIFGVEQLRRPLVIAIAELAGQGVEVETTIRVRRSA